jgi:large subunit ribosomal protein L10
MFAQSGNVPAKLIKEFRKSHDKPVLKGAYVQESVYVGENMLDTLVSIKTREELIGDIIMLLQSPAKNVIGALQSGGNKLHGVLETLSKKEE